MPTRSLLPMLASLSMAFLPLLSTARAGDAELEELKARVKQLEAEVKTLRERLDKLDPEAKPAALQGLNITVLAGDWGDASIADVQAVCRSSARELYRYFPNRKFEPITIQSDSKRGPMVIFGKGKEGERRVLLNVQGSFWAQFAYQSAHEYCHIACNYREANRVNLWFEESLCETASLFVLRRMAESWKTNPPYPNWKSFAPKLADYADNRLKQTEKLDGLTLAQWFQRNEEELRKTGTDRKKNQVVANALLTLLEKNPRHWEAVGYLNLGDSKKELSFKEYLQDWHQRAPKDHQSFVAEVASKFGYTIE